MKRLRTKVVLVGVLGILSSALVLSSYTLSVSAASVYDNVFELTSQTSTSSNFGVIDCDPVDLSNSWGSMILDESYWSQAVYGSGTTYNEVSAAFQSAIDNGTGLAVIEREYTGGTAAGVGNTMVGPGDTWTQVTFTSDTTNYVDFSTYNNRKYALIHTGTSAPMYTIIIGRFFNHQQQTCSTGVAVSRKVPGNSSTLNLINNEFIIGQDSSEGSDFIFRQLFVNSAINYPSGYEGEQVSNIDLEEDIDEDSLNVREEIAQGTADTQADTDGDGLDDFVESQWNTDRDDVFCGTQCAYPDPTVKDIYVEIDWMNNPNDLPYQPSSAQLDQVESAFNTRNINVHFDTGQYGGGNELSNYEHTLPFVQNPSGLDFYDYKNGTSTLSADFDNDRKRIWHYMISGYQYAENIGSSGASFAGDDDLFISYGLIKDSQSSFGYLSLDEAIAGTIIHELGHNLCLTGTAAYSGQLSNCVYDGIDNANASSDYVSSMNYSYQMFMVDYSMGQNGSPNDHDDWSAVEIGLKDFSSADRDIGDVMNGKHKTKKLIQGISTEQAKDLRNKGKLGNRNMNYFTRQLQIMLVR